MCQWKKVHKMCTCETYSLRSTNERAKIPKTSIILGFQNYPRTSDNPVSGNNAALTHNKRHSSGGFCKNKFGNYRAL